MIVVLRSILWSFCVFGLLVYMVEGVEARAKPKPKPRPKVSAVERN